MAVGSCTRICTTVEGVGRSSSSLVRASLGSILSCVLGLAVDCFVLSILLSEICDRFGVTGRRGPGKCDSRKLSFNATDQGIPSES